MSLSLVTQDGRQIAPACTGPRFVCQGGLIRDQSQPHANIPLIEAETGLALFRRDANADPDERRAAQLRRWALDLERAILDCRVQRRAAGRDPYYADNSLGARLAAEAVARAADPTVKTRPTHGFSTRA